MRPTRAPQEPPQLAPLLPSVILSATAEDAAALAPDLLAAFPAEKQLVLGQTASDGAGAGAVLACEPPARAWLTRPVCTAWLGGTADCRVLAFAVVRGGEAVLTCAANGALEERQLTSPYASSPVAAVQLDEALKQAAMSADGSTVLAVTSNGTLKVFEAASWKSLPTPPPTGFSTHLAVQTNVATLAAGATLSLLRLAANRAKDGPATVAATRQFSANVAALAGSGDSTRLAVGLADGSVEVLSWDDLSPVATLPARVPVIGDTQPLPIASIALSDDGATAAVAYSERVCVWDVTAAAAPLAELAHAHAVACALSADGNALLVSTHANGSADVAEARLCDLTSCRQGGAVTTLHTWAVPHAGRGAFAPGGARLLLESRVAGLQLWRAARDGEARALATTTRGVLFTSVQLPDLSSSAGIADTYASIVAAPCFATCSAEELRLADGLAGVRGCTTLGSASTPPPPPPQGGAADPFNPMPFAGAPAPQGGAVNPFSPFSPMGIAAGADTSLRRSAETAFGAPAVRESLGDAPGINAGPGSFGANALFDMPSPAPAPFGAASGAPGMFGASGPGPAPSAFGVAPDTSSASAAFGAAPTGAFGAPSAALPSAFGAALATPAAPLGFGAGFGAAPAGVLGTPSPAAPSMFGIAPAPAGAYSLFGAAPAGGFGVFPAFPATPAAPVGGFGTASTPFASSFGAATPAPGGFGAAPAGGFGAGFGTPLFGAAPPTSAALDSSSAALIARIDADWGAAARSSARTPTPASSSFGAATPAPGGFGAAPAGGFGAAAGGFGAATAPSFAAASPAPDATPPAAASDAASPPSPAAQLAAVAGGGACVRLALRLPMSPALAKQPPTPEKAPAALAPLRALRVAARALLAEQPLPHILRSLPTDSNALAAVAEARETYGQPAGACACAEAQAAAAKGAEKGTGAEVLGLRLEGWTVAHDVALASLLDQLEFPALPLQSIALRTSALQAALRARGGAFPLLEPFAVAALAARSAAHDAFVALLVAAMPLLPLGTPPCGDGDALERYERGGSGGGAVASDGALPTAELVQPLLRLVRRSHHAQLVELERNRLGSSDCAPTPDVTLDRQGTGRLPLLHQVADKLMCMGGTLFRPCGSDPRRWWRVSRFVGESGIDGGGLYRDSVSCLADELQGLAGMPLNPPLLIPAPNSAAGVGTRGADAVPAPGEVAAKCAGLLRFTGRLMAGCALSPTGEHLALSLTPFTWAHLKAGAPPDSLAAFRSVDAHFVDAMQAMLDVEDEAAFELQFGDHPACVVRSDGAEVPLTDASGAPLVPTFAKRHSVVAAAVAARFAESAAATAALRAGMLDVMPPQLLALWPTAALELSVCGDPEISVEALKRCTSCNLYGASLHAFWGAVELMTHRQRSDLLRYATGRQRLPVSLEVTMLHGVDGSRRAKSATCSSTLYLPEYQTPQQALEKLLKSFELCLLAFETG